MSIEMARTVRSWWSQRRWRCAEPAEDGATAVEYSVLVGLVGTVIIGAVVALGSAVSDNLCASIDELRANGAAADGCDDPAGE